MNSIITFFRKNIPLVIGLGIFVLAAAAVAVAQSHEKNTVKVKIVKIVDGDTSTIEKTMDETSVHDFTKQLENVKGKNVQVMITVQEDSKDKKEKNRSAETMRFNFDMDRSMANAFAKAFVFSDSQLVKRITINDSTWKSFPKNFGFNFDFDDAGIANDFNFDFDIQTGEDGKKVIIKSDNNKATVINGDEENANISNSGNSNTKTRTKTVIVEDDKTNNKKKKVIVSTSVTVMDMDEEKEGKPEKSKEDMDFSFYPNPSDGNFVLELDLAANENAQVRIADMNGKEILREKLAGTGRVNKTINLQGKKGTFIVTIKQGKKTTSKKIIIE